MKIKIIFLPRIIAKISLFSFLASSLGFSDEIQVEIDGRSSPDALAKAAETFVLVVIDETGQIFAELSVEDLPLDQKRNPPRRRTGTLKIIDSGRLEWITEPHREQQSLQFEGKAFGLFGLHNDLSRITKNQRSIELKLLPQRSIVLRSKQEMINQIRAIEPETDLAPYRKRFNHVGNFLSDGLQHATDQELREIVAVATKEIWDAINEHFTSTHDHREAFLADTDWQALFEDVSELHLNVVANWKPEGEHQHRKKIDILIQFVQLSTETFRRCASPSQHAWPEAHFDLIINRSGGHRRLFLTSMSAFLDERIATIAQELDSCVEGANLEPNATEAVRFLVSTLKEGQSLKLVPNALEEKTRLAREMLKVQPQS